jgi:hypothetical protein
MFQFNFFVFELIHLSNLYVLVGFLIASSFVMIAGVFFILFMAVTASL